MATTFVERLEELLRLDKSAKPICSSPMQSATLELMSIVNSFWPEAHFYADLMEKLAVAAYLHAGIKCIRLPFDVCVEAEAFGCTWNRGRNDVPPSVMKPCFQRYSDFEKPKDIFTRGRFPIIEKVTRNVTAEYGSEVPVYNMIIGPMTLTGYLFGIEKVLTTSLIQPEKVARVVNQVALFSCEYANYLQDLGNDFLVVFDPLAAGDLLAPDQFETIVLPTYHEIRRRVKQRIILHICRDTSKILPFIGESGFQAFSFHTPEVEISYAREMLASRMALAGGVPLKSLVWGTAVDVRKAATLALRKGISILAPSCGFPPQTTIEKMKAMANVAS